MRKLRIPYFQIWYSSTYIALFSATLILLAATPGDLIYQSIQNDVLPNTFVIGGVTFLTVLVASLVYLTRLYTNRSVLAAIPKNYQPIEQGEVSRSVRKIIVKEWHRSALIAWDSRPRNINNEMTEEDKEGQCGMVNDISLGARQRGRIQNARVLPINPKSPSWGEIGHAGWSSPGSDDLPDLLYSSVFSEFPNLIEAKAVSLAPPDPTRASGGLPIADPRVVALLQRRPGMGLREYLAQLSRLGLVRSEQLATEFLERYEHARFSTVPLSEAQFRELTALFADVLAGMTELDTDLLLDFLEGEDEEEGLDAEEGSVLLRAGSVPDDAVESETGSVRRYSTPGLLSVGARSPSLATAPSRTSRHSADSRREAAAGATPRTPSERDLELEYFSSRNRGGFEERPISSSSSSGDSSLLSSPSDAASLATPVG